jgi:diacylglycerol kinase family enzyme
MKNGHHEGDKNIIKFTTDKVVLKFDEEIIANIDGDQLSSDKFIISLLDEKLEIYYDEKLVKHLKK